MLIKLTVTGDTSQGIKIKGASLMVESGLGQGLGGEEASVSGIGTFQS